jgi:hypothetical protein
MEARELRRERLAVFLSVEIARSSGPISGADRLRSHYAAVFDEVASQFADFASTLRTLFHGEASVRPMDDAAHCAFCPWGS